MNKESACKKMNELGKEKTPFLFIIDYEMQNCIVETPTNARQKGILFNFNGIRNYSEYMECDQNFLITKAPVSFSKYEKAFNIVSKHLKRGNSYLVNLTFETPIIIDRTLQQIFHGSNAKYRLLVDKLFVIFSPETFIKISEDKIYTFPMKGTIDATIPNAKEKLIANKKELAEHATIVDLLRNDLSRIASKVTVDQFRYIDKIESNQKSLFQVSSQISGILPASFEKNIGNIIFNLLPAGSISGAPKQKTVEIIAEAENYQRGYYTGIAGYYDGKNLDSCVLIRYIEDKNGQYVYKSGGGITTQSNAQDEYNELLDKIYVPIA